MVGSRFQIRSIFRAVALLVLVMNMSSCKVYFTQQLREEVVEQEIPLESIQYCVSRKIKLQRIESTSTVVNDTTKLDRTKEIVVDLVKIKRNTPGVVVNQFDSELEVAFENCEGCSLKFVRTERNADEVYQVGAIEWVNNVGQVDYNNNIYYIRPRNVLFRKIANNSALKVRNKYLYKFKFNKRKAKGRKVPN